MLHECLITWRGKEMRRQGAKQRRQRRDKYKEVGKEAKVEESTVTHRLLVVEDYMQVSYMMPGKDKKQNVSITEKEKSASTQKQQVTVADKASGPLLFLHLTTSTNYCKMFWAIVEWAWINPPPLVIFYITDILLCNFSCKLLAVEPVLAKRGANCPSRQKRKMFFLWDDPRSWEVQWIITLRSERLLKTIRE